MKDNELIALLRSEIAIALTNAGLDFPVVQLVQPTQQGTETGGTVYIQKLFDKVAGWSQRKKTYKSENKNFENKEDTQYVTTIQISALNPQTPGDTSAPTASDVVNIVKLHLCHNTTLQKLRQKNIGLFRVIDVSNNYFHNDLSRFQAMPGFQLSFTHVRSMTINTPRLERIESHVYKV